jgi:hypothetical protein
MYRTIAEIASPRFEPLVTGQVQRMMLAGGVDDLPEKAQGRVAGHWTGGVITCPAPQDGQIVWEDPRLKGEPL